MKSQPQIKKIYMKSDNAGCYHNPWSLEALFNIFKKHGLTLQRYDFNEPAWEEDCDRESVTTKSYIHNYLDNGHDLLNADDVFLALHYGSGIQDAVVCAEEIDFSIATLTGAKIQNFRIITPLSLRIKEWFYGDILMLVKESEFLIVRWHSSQEQF